MHKSKLVRLLALFLTIGVVAAACGSDGDDSAATTTAAAATTAAPAATTAAATTAAPAATTAAQVEVVQGGSLLDTVQARGMLHCGVSGSAVAFSETQADG